MAYPERLDSFQDKLNKKTDGSIYVIEEKIQLKEGKHEKLLAHDNINNSTIRVFTGAKLTGDEITDFTISVPAETPWRRVIRLFSEEETVYITYETQGDTVEADDINVLQDSITATQAEIERYKIENNVAKTNIDSRLKTAEQNKAEKTYVDTQLLLKANKSSTYTKEETDQRIQLVVDAAPEALNTLKEIADALNNDPNFAGTMTKQLAGKVDKATGKQLSTEDYTSSERAKLAGIANSANNYIHPGTHPASIMVQDANNRLVTDAEKSSWNAKSNLTLGETSTTAYRGDNGKVAYNHSQVAHAPSKAQKNSDITKAEIEAKLTGDITTHTHSQYATKADLGSAGYGDMLKSVYDTDNDGIIDNAKKVNGHTVLSDVPTGAKFTDTIYSHPTTPGNKHIPSGGISGQVLRWAADGTAAWGADNNTTYTVATTITNGLMSKEDKVKLDKLTFPITWNQLKGV